MKPIIRGFACLLLAAMCAGCSMGSDQYIGSKGARDKNRQTAVPAASAEPAATEPSPTAEGGAAESWTVLVYMNGSDLESENGLATRDIREMLTAPYDSDVHVLLATGGTLRWEYEGIDSHYLQYWRVEEDSLTLLENRPPVNMGVPQTLTDFVRYGLEGYPADRTALIFWDHGSGPLVGYGADEMYGYDSLMLSEMAQALGDAGLADKLTLVGFDACLMATLEVASQLTPYARYLMASEELEPGTGWSYTHLLTRLSVDPAVDMNTLFGVAADGMLWNAGQQENADLCTLSLVDLAAVEPVEQALDGLAVRITQGLGDPDEAKRITLARADTLLFGGSDPEEGIVDVVDLRDFAYKILPLYPDEGQALINALDTAILDTRSGKARMAAGGLSIYFPFLDHANRTELTLRYAQEVPFSSEWSGFAQAFVTMLDEREGETAAPAVSGAQEEGGQASIQLDPGQLDDIGYLFYSLALDLGDGYYLELGHDDDLYVDWDTGYAQADFQGRWVFLNENLVPFYIIEESDYGNLYNIPALLNGEPVNIRCAWYWDSDGDGGSYTVLGAVRGVDRDTRIVNRQMIPLSDGDVVTPLFNIVDGQGQFVEQYEGDPLVIDGSPLLEDWELSGDTYLFGFRILDWSMNLMGTEYFSIDWNPDAQ